MYKENSGHNCSLSLLQLESMASKIKLKKTVVAAWSCNLIYTGALCLQFPWNHPPFLAGVQRSVKQIRLWDLTCWSLFSSQNSCGFFFSPTGFLSVLPKDFLFAYLLVNLGIGKSCADRTVFVTAPRASFASNTRFSLCYSSKTSCLSYKFGFCWRIVLMKLKWHKFLK